MDPKKIHPEHKDNGDDLFMRLLIRCVFGSFVLALLGIGSVVWDEWPSPPPEFQVKAVWVDPLIVSVSPPRITGNWNITFYITTHHSDERFLFKQFDAQISYKEKFISGVVIKPFEFHPTKPKHKQNLVVNANINASSASFYSHEAAAMVYDLVRRRVVNFEAKARARLYLLPHNKKIHYEITALCYDLKVEFSSNMTGAMLQIPPPCSVYSFRVYN